MSIITLVRGLPGSGKTSFANKGLDKAVAADDYFVDNNGVYNFNPSKLGEAHTWCYKRVMEEINVGGNVTVHNTFSQRWEMEQYLSLAEEEVIKVFVVDLFDGGCNDEELFERNSHGVPLKTIKAMRERWEHDWRVGNPLPPWER